MSDPKIEKLISDWLAARRVDRVVSEPCRNAPIRPQ